MLLQSLNPEFFREASVVLASSFGSLSARGFLVGHSSGIGRKHEVKAGIEVILIVDNRIFLITVLKLLYLKYVLLHHAQLSGILHCLYEQQHRPKRKNSQRKRKKAVLTNWT